MKKITYDKKNLYKILDCLDALGIGYTVMSIKIKASPAKVKDIGWIIEFEMDNAPNFADIDPRDVIPSDEKPTEVKCVMCGHEMFYLSREQT